MLGGSVFGQLFPVVPDMFGHSSKGTFIGFKMLARK